MTLEAHEIEKINEARLAIMLHKLPSEIRAAPARDIQNLIVIVALDNKLAEERAKAQRA